VDDLVERLARTDQLDRERGRQEAELAKARAALAEAEAALATATSGVAEAQALVDANRADERAAQRRLDELKQKHASAIRILETGAGDAAAAERQLENCERLIDETETAMLEVLEAQDHVKGTLAAAQERRATAEATAGRARTEVPPKVEELTAAIADLGGRVDAELAALPADIRKRYQALRAAGKWPVAHVKDGSCAACRMTVPPQKVTEVKKGRLEECNGCKRWLVMAA
jgi:predicted  nucleic acid-binding Zn-ribbon protein